MLAGSDWPMGSGKPRLKKIQIMHAGCRMCKKQGKPKGRMFDDISDMICPRNIIEDIRKVETRPEFGICKLCRAESE